MADKKKGKKRPSRPGEEDRWLWDEVTKTVTPLSDNSSALFPSSAADYGPEEKDSRAGYRPKNSASSSYALKNSRPQAQPFSETAKSPLKPKKKPSSDRPGVDRRTEENFRRGKMPLEATLDLHGLSQAQARPALTHFIQHAYQSGKRCVLVITGKGKGRGADRYQALPPTDDHWLAPQAPGVLKRTVPLWLNEAPLASLVLRTAPAKPRHGGAGALYILIRRKRS